MTRHMDEWNGGEQQHKMNTLPETESEDVLSCCCILSVDSTETVSPRASEHTPFTVCCGDKVLVAARGEDSAAS